MSRIVLIDSAVHNFQYLVNAARAITNEVFILDPERDGVVQITELLKQYQTIQEIHLVSHAKPGSLRLGNTCLSLNNLKFYAHQIQNWSINDRSSFLLYGCKVALGKNGIAFLQKLSGLTQANVVGSATRTGNAALGGDWNLEIATGQSLPLVLFPKSVQAAYQFVFADPFDSDDFNNSVLDPRWSFINPLGDGSYSLTGAGSGDAYLNLVVPTGASHDLWGASNRSVRAMQASTNGDFTAEVKFGSQPSQSFQMQGILVEESANRWIRFDTFHDGTNLRVFAATTLNGTSQARINRAIAPGAANYLRVTRQGNVWTLQYSADGSSWTSAGNFTQALSVSSVGTFAANHATSGSSPGFTSRVDYFFNTAAPIVPEDGSSGTTNQPPLANPDSATVLAGNPVTINVLSNDSDSDGSLNPGSVAIVNGPANGSLSIGADGRITYTHNGSSTTSDSFSYTVRDNQGALSNPATVGIVVNDLSRPVIDVWYGADQRFGHIGRPQTWINVLGNVSDPDGIASLTYSLNGGAQIPLTVGENAITTRRLIAPGDFNIDIAYSALNGSAVDDTVVITATDTLGNSSTSTITIDYEAGSVWPAPYSINWGSVTNIQDVAQVVDGDWQIQENGVRIMQPGYDRLIGIGDVSWRDYEVTVPITVHALGRSNGRDGTAVGILMRWTGHTDSPVPNQQPEAGWLPNGVIGWFRNSNLRISDDGNDFATLASAPRSVQAGKTYVFKMRVETLQAGGSLYSLKVWEVGQSEPTNWDLQGQTPTSDLAQGSLLLLAHEHDVSFGNVTINPVGNSVSGAMNQAMIASSTVSNDSASDSSNSVTGTDGDDVLIDVDPSVDYPGVGEIDTLIGLDGADTFVLGDNTKAYYDDSDPTTLGQNDYALITDFSSAQQDVIRLFGNSADYLLETSPQDLPSGTAIFRTSAQRELIAIVQGNNNLDLASPSFSFV